VLITKFNAMIRNRFLWAVLAVVISVSFVLMGFAGRSGCASEARSRRAEGTLFGEDVSRGEFFMARFFEMGMRDHGQSSPERSKLLRERTWQRLAMLRTAQNMGVYATDEEVSAMLRKDPTFAVNGVFNKDRYRAIVQSELRVDLPTFENYLRQDLTIRKLVGMLESACWTSPSELNEKLDNLTDELSVEYVSINADDFGGDVELTEEEVLAYFDEDRERFKVPEQVSVRYVWFPLTNYYAEAAARDEDILDYYYEHIDDYTTPGTNDTSVPQPFEEVRDDVAELLRRREATFMARDRATEFVMELAPDRYGNAQPLAEAALSYGLTVLTTAHFSVYGEVPGMDVGGGFNRAAFELDASDPEKYFSDAIVGLDSVYVLAAHDRVAPRLPEYDEVAEEVRRLATEEAKQKRFLERADEIRQQVREAAGEGRFFTEAVQDLGLSAVTTTEVFAVYAGPSNETEHMELVLRSVAALGEGELSELIPTDDGVVLASVVSRAAGDPLAKQYLRGEVLSMLNRYRAGLLFEDWRGYLLARADLEDLAAAGAERTDSPTE